MTWGFQKLYFIPPTLIGHVQFCSSFSSWKPQDLTLCTLPKNSIARHFVGAFIWETVHLCGSRGCKTTVGQSLISEKNWSQSSFSYVDCVVANIFHPCFWTFNFYRRQLCSPLSHTDTHYFIWRSSQFLNV